MKAFAPAMSFFVCSSDRPQNEQWFTGPDVCSPIGGIMADYPEDPFERLPRNYACLYLFLFYCACFAATIDLIVSGRFVVLGIVLAPFALIEAAQYGLALLERPTYDRLQSFRLSDSMNELSVAAGFGVPDGLVLVQTPVHLPIRVWPKQRLIKAETSFVKGLNNAQLRALGAYGLACYFFPPKSWSVSVYLALSAALGAAVGVAAITAGSPLLGAAMIPFAVWAATAVFSVIASAGAVRAYAHTDAQTAALLGDTSEAAMALELMRDARMTLRAGEPLKQRLVLRSIQPISPSWHEDERGRAVSRQPIPSLATPRIYAPRPPEPQYEP
jgi:hypothetical protein